MLLQDFFRDETRRQRPVPGAPETLADLAQDRQILVLTNVPAGREACRRANLDTLGMDYPMIAHKGLKGPAVAALARRMRAPVAFVDDSPLNIASAAEHAPQVTGIQFIGSELVRAVAPRAPEARHLPPDWAAIAAILRGD